MGSSTERRFHGRLAWPPLALAVAVATSTVASGACVGTGDARGGGYRHEPTVCRYNVPLSLGLREGEKYACGDLLVPLDRGSSDATEVRVHYVRFFGAQNQTATVFLEGGPGANGQGVVDSLDKDFLNRLLEVGDFMVYAQRGTTLSRPSLACADDEAPAACRDRLRPTANLAAFTTSSNADDLEDLRKALGLRQLNLYGISYGTRLGLEMMRRHGDSLRAVVIDGNVPPQVKWTAEAPAGFYAALQALAGACAGTPSCAGAYGDVTQTFLGGVTALNQQPLNLMVRGEALTIDGTVFADLVFQMLYGPADRVYPVVPLLVSDLAARRSDRVLNIISAVIGSSIGENPTFSEGMYTSVVCGEHFNPPDPSTYDRVTANVPPALRDAMRRGWEFQLARCALWPLARRENVSNDPVNSGVPTLVTSGEIDPITPPAYGQLVASTLSRSATLVYKKAGHGATLASPCGRGHVASFLAEPSRALDPTCANNATLRFVIPDANGTTFLASERGLRPEDFPYSPQLHDALERARQH